MPNTIYATAAALAQAGEIIIRDPLTNKVVGRITLDGYADEPAAVWPFSMTFSQLLDQDKVWINKTGERIEIRRMTLDYVANVLRFIRDKRGWLAKEANMPSEHYLFWPVTVALRKRLADAYHDHDRHYRPNWDGKLPATYSMGVK